MIPKKIHYCWFGDKPKNKLFYRCLASWQKYFPDYIITEWNESNFDVNFTNYTKEAYAARRYAFVSDVARLKIIYDEGGLYFDTDVEVLKKFDDKLLKNGYFGEEEPGLINTGLGFAAPKHHKIVKLLLDGYRNLEFKNSENCLSLTPCPVIDSATLIKNGYKVEAGKNLAGIPIFNQEFIGGYDSKNYHFIINSNTYSVHHYNASWYTPKERLKFKSKKTVSAIIGIDNYRKLKQLKQKFKK